MSSDGLPLRNEVLVAALTEIQVLSTGNVSSLPPGRWVGDVAMEWGTALQRIQQVAVAALATEADA